MENKQEKDLAKEMLQEGYDESREFAESTDLYGLVLDTSVAIGKLREELGLSQQGLAEKAGIAQSTVGRIETGSTTPTLKVLSKMATATKKKVVIKFVDREESMDVGCGFVPWRDSDS